MSSTIAGKFSERPLLPSVLNVVQQSGGVGRSRGFPLRLWKPDVQATQRDHGFLCTPAAGQGSALALGAQGEGAFPFPPLLKTKDPWNLGGDRDAEGPMIGRSVTGRGLSKPVTQT